MSKAFTWLVTCLDGSAESVISKLKDVFTKERFHAIMADNRFHRVSIIKRRKLVEDSTRIKTICQGSEKELMLRGGRQARKQRE